MRFILLLFLFSKTAGLFSQPSSITVINGDLEVIHNSQLSLIYLPIEKFKSLEWQPGIAYYQDGSSRAYEGLRLNLREDKAEVNANNQILEILPGLVTGFSMGNGTSLSHIFVNVPLQKPLYMELFAPGKADLLIQRKDDTKEEVEILGVVSTINFEKEKKEEEINYKEFFYVWYAGKIREYKPSRKFILEVMADHSDEIRFYLKNKNTNLRNANQVIALFEYYNSL